ncbi:hypothetical protein D3C71_859140 [compost metagenome]
MIDVKKTQQNCNGQQSLEKTPQATRRIYFRLLAWQKMNTNNHSDQQTMANPTIFFIDNKIYKKTIFVTDDYL